MERHLHFALLGLLSGDMLQIPKLPDRDKSQNHYGPNQQPPPESPLVFRLSQQMEQAAKPGVLAPAAAISGFVKNLTVRGASPTPFGLGSSKGHLLPILVDISV